MQFCGILFLYKECYFYFIYILYIQFNLVVCVLFPARSAINYLKVNMQAFSIVSLTLAVYHSMSYVLLKY